MSVEVNYLPGRGRQGRQEDLIGTKKAKSRSPGTGLRCPGSPRRPAPLLRDPTGQPRAEAWRGESPNFAGAGSGAPRTPGGWYKPAPPFRPCRSRDLGALVPGGGSGDPFPVAGRRLLSPLRRSPGQLRGRPEFSSAFTSPPNQTK